MAYPSDGYARIYVFGGLVVVVANDKKTGLTVATSALALVGIIIGGWWAAESRFDLRYVLRPEIAIVHKELVTQSTETKRGFGVIEKRLLEAEYRNIRRRYFDFENMKARRSLTPIEETEYRIVVEDLQNLKSQMDKAR